MIQKSGGMKFRIFGACLFLGLFGFLSLLHAASIGEKDPVRETQTTPVPVTEELLNREGGDPGPASPSFKLKDSTDFFSREHDGLEEELAEITGEESEEPEEFGEDWLFWEKDEENSEDSGLISLEEE